MKLILLLLAILLVVLGLAGAVAAVSDNAAVIWQAQAAIEANKNAQTAINALALRSVLDGLAWLAVLLIALAIGGAWLWRRWKIYRQEQARLASAKVHSAQGRWLSGPNAHWQKIGASGGNARLAAGKGNQALKVMRLSQMNERQQLRYLLLRDAVGDEQALALVLTEGDAQMLQLPATASQTAYQVIGENEDDEELDW